MQIPSLCFSWFSSPDIFIPVSLLLKFPAHFKELLDSRFNFHLSYNERSMPWKKTFTIFSSAAYQTWRNNLPNVRLTKFPLISKLLNQLKGHISQVHFICSTYLCGLPRFLTRSFSLIGRASCKPALNCLIHGEHRQKNVRNESSVKLIKHFLLTLCR